jgi:mycoredoxin
MLTMYSTAWCGHCHRLSRQLDREGIGYTVIDIDADKAAAEFVMSVNGGNQTVPTVVFPDGTALTNPTIVQVLERLGQEPAGNASPDGASPDSQVQTR